MLFIESCAASCDRTPKKWLMLMRRYFHYLIHSLTLNEFYKKILNFKVHLLHIWLTSMMRASSLQSVFKTTLLRIIQCMNVLTLDLINLSDNNNSSEYDVDIATIVITCFSMHTTSLTSHINWNLLIILAGLIISGHIDFCVYKRRCAQQYVSSSSPRISETEMFWQFKTRIALRLT